MVERDGLQVEIDDSTQYATVYRCGRPVGTLQRRRVYAAGPKWTLYDLSGEVVAAGPLPGLLLRKFARRFPLVVTYAESFGPDMPAQIVAYPGSPLHGRGEYWRPLNDWEGNRLGVVRFVSSWPVKSYIGTRMYAVRAIVNGHRYHGRGFGAGMSVVLRRSK